MNVGLPPQRFLYDLERNNVLFKYTHHCMSVSLSIQADVSEDLKLEMVKAVTCRLGKRFDLDR